MNIGPRARTGLFMFLSPKGSLIVSIGRMYEKSKYAILTNLTVAVFPNNYIEEGYPPSYQILILRNAIFKIARSRISIP